MNSSAWLVSSGAERYVLKISDASEEPGLQVAAWLEARGLRTGAPMHMTVRDGRLVALLRFADGRPLATSHADVEALGETLGRAHSLLVGAPVPPGPARWPWSWLDSGVIDDPDLRAAAIDAIDAAERLAADVDARDPSRGSPLRRRSSHGGDDVALIDWGAACHGPLAERRVHASGNPGGTPGCAAARIRAIDAAPARPMGSADRRPGY